MEQLPGQLALPAIYLPLSLEGARLVLDAMLHLENALNVVAEPGSRWALDALFGAGQVIEALQEALR